MYIYTHTYTYTFIYIWYIYFEINLFEYHVLRSTAADKHVPTEYALRQMQTHI